MKLQLHDLIRLHPSIAAECYDTIRKLLEGEYVVKEFQRKHEELEEIIKNIISPDHVPRIMDTNEEPTLKMFEKLI